jgi:hypothetical protein
MNNSPDASGTATGLLDGFFNFVNKASASYNAFQAEKDKRTAGPAQTSNPAPGTVAVSSLNPQTLLVAGVAIVGLVLLVGVMKK